MDMIGGAEILRRRFEMAEKSNVVKGEVFQGENEEWYWHGKAGNGEVVANSAPESYTRLEDATRAFEATFGSDTPCEVTTVVNAQHHGSEAVTEQDKSTAEDAQEEFQKLEEDGA